MSVQAFKSSLQNNLLPPFISCLQGHDLIPSSPILSTCSFHHFVYIQIAGIVLSAFKYLTYFCISDFVYIYIYIYIYIYTHIYIYIYTDVPVSNINALRSTHSWLPCLLGHLLFTPARKMMFCSKAMTTPFPHALPNFCSHISELSTILVMVLLLCTWK
jgi:hypothetical protein